MPIYLKHHNEQAYQKVKKAFNESNKVAIIHPTGTGKMYIALKMLEENKDKKAIYVAPSNSILHKLKQSIFAEGMDMSDFPNLKRFTYQKLMILSEEEIENLKADIIVLDEFHHYGAPEWRKGVDRLIRKNPNASILGLSATPLRYLDDLRDMSDELFDNNVASEMTLDEAINEGILPKATYVSTLYGYKEELNKMKFNIDKIKDEDKKKQAQYLFDKLSKKLDQNIENLPELFTKYMKNRNGKYIVFCRNIKDMQEKMAQANNMFESVNSNITIRGVSSKIRENDKILNDFENDDDEDSLKLLYAVDMLNEGYHIKNLDGVIMMRPTFSPTVFTQQLGRALTIGGEKAPIILDLVNNFDTCKIIEDFAQSMKQYKEYKGENTKKDKEKSRIYIFDKTKEFREIASKIAELSKKRTISLEEKIEIFERFAETGEKLTGNTVFEEYPIGHWGVKIRDKIKRTNEGKDKINITKEQLDRLKIIGILDRQIESRIDEKIDSLVQWVKKYPKIKISKQYSKDILKKYSTTDEERKQLNEEYKKMRKYYSYILKRKCQNKLNEEQFLKCKEGNIGGVFGYSTQVEDLAKKYAQGENTIEYIITNYGSIDNFKELHRKGNLNKKDTILAHSLFKSLLDIDFDPNSNNYARLCCAIMNEASTGSGLKLYSSKKIDEALKTLNENERYIIKRRFGLTKEDLQRDLKTSISKVQKIEEKAFRKLKNYFDAEEIIWDLDKIKNSPFLTDDEKRTISDLEDNIYKSDIIINNSAPKKENIENEDILKGIEIVNSIIKSQRVKQVDNASNKIIIDRLNLSNWAYSCLQRNRIYTLEDLSQVTVSELHKMMGIGKKSLEKIIRKAEEYGVNLKESDEIENDEKGIEELGLSNWIYRRLQKNGIYTLKGISQLTVNELYEMRGIGNKSLEEIIKKAREHGITLKEYGKLEDDNDIKELEIHTEEQYVRSEGKPNDKIDDLETARAERDRLETHMKQLQGKIKEAEELLSSYNNLLDNDKNTNFKE